VVTTTPSHFALELVGGRRSHRDLRVVKRTLSDQDLFFGQFQYPDSSGAMLKFEADKCGVKDLTLVTPGAQGELDRRFPGASTINASTLQFTGDDDIGPALRISPNANYVQVEDVVLANAFESMVRIRHIRFALLVTKDTPVDEYKAHLKNLLNINHGAQLVAVKFIPAGEIEEFHLAAQFANIFLMNHLHETSISSFISDHGDLLTTALGATRLIPQPELEWVVASPDPEETSVIPDLLVVRPDGYCDIYDLKLPLLNRKKITVGSRNRRRFYYTVEDGIAQLAHYRDFLSIPEHATLAEEKFGARFSDPKCVLVVGNYENVNADEVAEARRRFPNLEVIDYDSILQLYLINKGLALGAHQ
jgi:hypothetical protein